MKWFYVFLKSLKEQFRDYWILVITLVFAPFFVFMYYLMMDTETLSCKIISVNRDVSFHVMHTQVNLGDSLVCCLKSLAGKHEELRVEILEKKSREEGIRMLQEGKADLMLVLPEDLTEKLLSGDSAGPGTTIELVGDLTETDYIIGAIWTAEGINQLILEASGTNLPVAWKETALGHSGQRTEFELYVPGLLIFSIIMLMFTASASIVREPEAGTLERLKISRLSALEFLTGISLVQVLIGIVSLLLTMAVALSLGYELIPGTFGFILLVAFLTSLSMISFSLIVAAICRSVKDVAIIGTFPLMLMMFFSGAFFPLAGGKLFSIQGYTLHLNDLLSPTWAVDALNKVLIKGLEIRSALPEIIAIFVLTCIYFLLGIWSFRLRHMRAA